MCGSFVLGGSERDASGSRQMTVFLTVWTDMSLMLCASGLIDFLVITSSIGTSQTNAAFSSFKHRVGQFCSEAQIALNMSSLDAVHDRHTLIVDI